MFYLVFTTKTRVADGKYVGYLDCQNFGQAKVAAKKLGYSVIFAATPAVIKCFQNDARFSSNGKNSLPLDFNIYNTRKLN